MLLAGPGRWMGSRARPCHSQGAPASAARLKAAAACAGTALCVRACGTTVKDVCVSVLVCWGRPAWGRTPWACPRMGRGGNSTAQCSSRGSQHFRRGIHVWPARWGALSWRTLFWQRLQRQSLWQRAGQAAGAAGVYPICWWALRGGRAVYACAGAFWVRGAQVRRVCQPLMFPFLLFHPSASRRRPGPKKSKEQCEAGGLLVRVRERHGGAARQQHPRAPFHQHLRSPSPPRVSARRWRRAPRHGLT
jgi:hypothetical protein